MANELAELTVTVRHNLGKNAARQMRKEGLIPAVVYGRGVPPLAVAVQESSFLQALPRGAWQTAPVRLHIQGEGESAREDAPAAMVAEVQQNTLTRKLHSIDFHLVSLEDRVHVSVPIRPVGESPGVKRGGLVELLVHEVSVEARPEDLPERLEARISDLDIHGSVRIRDLALPEGVTVLAPPDEIVLLIAAPAKLDLPEAAEAAPAEEPAEPEVIRARPSAEA